MAQRVLETLPRMLLETELERLRSRIAELEAALAERRALLGRLAPAPELTELEVHTP